LSVAAVSQIIGRALMDPDYRRLWFDDPSSALAVYALTVDETMALRGIAREQFARVEAGLYERIALSLMAAEGEGSRAAQEIVVKKLKDLFDELE
jgi:hypothetical protein